MTVPSRPFAKTIGPVSRAGAEESASAVASVLLVVGFWWSATGLTFLMQSSRNALLLTILVTTGLAIYGLTLIVASRRQATVSAARRAFLGSSLIWWWCATVFYAGWGIDLGQPARGEPGSLTLALQAIAATWRADMLGVVALAVVGLLAWRQRNHVAFWALLVYWGTLQTAKLNVFFGVRNAGAELLPPHLEGLGAFFGPARTSWLLPLTVVVLAIVTAAVARRAMRATDAHGRHGHAMLAVLLALAVLEHAVLGMPFMLPLWDMFLGGR